MSVLVLFDLETKAGKEEEAVALFAGMFPDTRAFDGCESITLHRDQDAASRFTLVERFASREHYEAYLRWRTERGDVALLGALLAGPPSIRFFDDVDA